MVENTNQEKIIKSKFNEKRITIAFIGLVGYIHAPIILTAIFGTISIEMVVTSWIIPPLIVLAILEMYLFEKYTP